MAKVNWRDAIVKVLQDAGKPLHYAQIAQDIIDGNYRASVGATPAATVAANLSMSLKNEGSNSPFYKAEKGVYGLRALAAAPTDAAEVEDEAVQDAGEMGLINAFGMFWRRDAVRWTRQPALLGSQQTGSKSVDFSSQTGVYLLHDGDRVVYVGRAIDRPLGVRLSEHTRDRLGGRWDRFSWFGVQKVTEDGALSAPPEAFTLENLIATMEALLIEGLEPPQNRKQGDGFNAVEFLQSEDPDLTNDRLLRELTKKLS